ncbi:hypothetical protein CFOL_v3_30743 [Cephalotus follicularis]|uniref:Uncharacterized protein n=1 Tax=Cephalotus follicularis TaxID=3775 RepID=A0A1Q3D486_CEPFO|nr:hypothetical protein CFOL_v3_30743 [Cephalotus follicularis]
MNKSPVCPNYDTSDYGESGFDPRVDFLQFLEEGKQHASEVTFRASLPYSEEAGKNIPGEERKGKKSWKHSLFLWWKAEKNSNPIMESASNAPISKPRRGHVSGSMYQSGMGGKRRHWRPTSEPLSSIFNSTRTAANEMPYVCLDYHNNPHHVKTYGPLYLVT